MLVQNKQVSIKHNTITELQIKEHNIYVELETLQ